MIDMRPSGGGKQRLVFLAPSRSLIGYHGEFLTDTSGTGVMNRIFHSYAPYKGVIPGRRNGTLVSLEKGAEVAYALWNLEERGPLFISPGERVYGGMIIGEHSRGGDLNVNRSEEHTSELQSLIRTSYAAFCLKKKKLTKQ